MESQSTQNVVVSDSHLGLFTLVGVVLIALSFIWWKLYPWAPPPQRFSVLFHDVAGLNPNAPVNINGMKVGSVEQMNLMAPDKVRVQVKITSKEARVPVNSKAYIHTNGLVGAKYVELVLPEKMSERQLLLNKNNTLIGVDPVRSEFMVNRMVKAMNELDISGMQNAVKTQLARLGGAADNISVLSMKLRPTAQRVADAGEGVSALSADLRKTSSKMNKILDNPKMSSDLKETSQNAKHAADRFHAAIDTASTTLGDDTIRKDLVSAIENINDSTDHIENAVKGVGELGNDKELREDLKEVISKAGDTADKINTVVSKPVFDKELRSTLVRAQSTLGEFETLGKRMNKTMGKRAPLLHMLIGRPGKLSPEPDKIHQASANEKVPL